MRGVNLRTNANVISPTSFQARKTYLVSAYKDGAFLADPESRGKPRPNPITDPAAMEGMMGMMKGNVAMMVPQTLIMGWINTFFSGFVIRTCSLSAYSLQADDRTCGLPWQADMQRQKYPSNNLKKARLTFSCSEIAFPFDSAVQVDAAVGRGHTRSGCEMGIESIMVLPNALRPAAGVQFHPRKRQL